RRDGSRVIRPAPRPYDRQGVRVRVGPYEVGALLGAGATGVVHEAVHAEAGVPVALKVLTQAHLAGAEPDLQVEVDALARLRHARLHGARAGGRPAVGGRPGR